MTALPDRLQALHTLVDAPPAILTPDDRAAARELLDRAGERLTVASGLTVAAIAGGSGSGKSALFNAVVGVALSPTGLRRPTTLAPVACVYGSADAGPLLDWLGVPERQRLRRASALDPESEAGLEGLVLLDLPDHDTVHHAHREIVDRITARADLVIWVVDPQKYADALAHERYLRRLAGHGGVLTVVLNRVDRLPDPARPVVAADLARLLAADGIVDARMVPTVATTGEGVGGVRRMLVEAVAARAAAEQRIDADLRVLAERLRRRSGTPPDVEKRAAIYRRLADDAAAAVDVAGWARRVAAGEARRPASASVDIGSFARRAAGELAGGLPDDGAAAVQDAADRAAAGSSGRIDEAFASVDVDVLRPRGGWLPGRRGRRRDEHAQRLEDAYGRGLRDALGPVVTALDDALRPYCDVAERAGDIAPR